MPTLQIPVDSTFPSYEFQIDLDGVAYGLRFDYNFRRNNWSLRLLDSEGNIVIGGVPVQHGFLPLFQYKGINEVPKGDMLPLDESGEEKDPSRDDLGNNVLVFYEEI